MEWEWILSKPASTLLLLLRLPNTKSQSQKPYATTSPGISSAVCFPFAPPSFREEDDPALLLLLLLLLPQVPAMSITSKSPVVLFPPSL